MYSYSYTIPDCPATASPHVPNRRCTSDMTILITGGAGFIGTNIAQLARKRNYRVVILDSFIRKGVEENARWLERIGCSIVRGDVRNEQDFARISATPDAIIHLAANPGIPWSIAWPLYDFTTNALGTLHVLEYSRRNGRIPVVLASTNKVYTDELNTIPVTEKPTRYEWSFRTTNGKSLAPRLRDGISKLGVNESFPTDAAGDHPHSPYGVSKLAADLYCQEYFHMYGVPTVVNRMSCIYGVFQKGVEDQGWMDWFIRAKLQKLPLSIYGDGKQVRDALFGSDLAELYLREIEQIDRAKGQVMNVGGGSEHTTSLLEVVSYLDSKLDPPLKLEFKDWRPADQRVYISDHSKVTNLLSWKPVIGVREGLDIMWERITWDSDR